MNLRDIKYVERNHQATFECDDALRLQKYVGKYIFLHFVGEYAWQSDKSVSVGVFFCAESFVAHLHLEHIFE